MTTPLPRDRHLVIDASAVVALLADDGPAGDWVTANITGAALSAPELMPYEASNVLRRRTTNGALDSSGASLAHEDLLALDVDYFPHHSLAHRSWELRHNLTVYDASYVALAEWLKVPLITLDARIARASGPRCRVMAFDNA